MAPPAVALSLLASVNAAFAVQTPFGIATPDSTGPAFTGPLGGVFAWVALRQAEFYRVLTEHACRYQTQRPCRLAARRRQPGYGVFHAVGPGHGKSVITSYLLVIASRRRARIFLSFAEALQLVAFGFNSVAAVILRATAIGMTQTTDWFLIFSYALVAAVGAWLLWSKLSGRGHHHHAHDHGT